MKTYYLYLHRCNAKVAQLVELQPSKLVVASSSLVFRSFQAETIVSAFFISQIVNQFRFLVPRVVDFV
ncbi:MAG: hypothetical protein RL542_1539 [Bacteroidota bacterium]